MMFTKSQKVGIARKECWIILPSLLMLIVGCVQASNPPEIVFSVLTDSDATQRGFLEGVAAMSEEYGLGDAALELDRLNRSTVPVNMVLSGDGRAILSLSENSRGRCLTVLIFTDGDEELANSLKQSIVSIATANISPAADVFDNSSCKSNNE